MRDLIAALPDQLRWGLDLAVAPLDPPDDVVLLGMGGSGMAAAVGALTVDAPVPVTHIADYDLPAWVPARRPLVVAVSYSGNTEETVTAAEAAVAAGCRVVVISAGGKLAALAERHDLTRIEVPGGLLPRVALGYQAAAVIRALDAAGLNGDGRSRIEAAAHMVESLVGKGDGPGVPLAEDLAEALDHRATVIYGTAGPAALAAYRWKTQINENAKMPAFASVIPEANHNEIEGWSTLPTMATRDFSIVMLHDPLAHPRNRKRARLTWEVMQGKVGMAGEVVAQGRDPLERVWSLITIGDLVSVVMAERHGVDPGPIATLEGFKRRLVEE